MYCRKNLQNPLFKIFCEVGSAHTSLILYTELKLLSQRNILICIFELRDHVCAFFLEHNFLIKLGHLKLHI